MSRHFTTTYSHRMRRTWTFGRRSINTSCRMPTRLLNGTKARDCVRFWKRSGRTRDGSNFLMSTRTASEQRISHGRTVECCFPFYVCLSSRIKDSGGRMWKRCIGILLLVAVDAVVFAQVGRLGPATVVDPSGTIAASRGLPDGPPQPAPRLSDGTVNLGRDHGEKGIWGLASVQNFAGFTPDTPKTYNRAQRGGAPSEPFIPFQT